MTCSRSRVKEHGMRMQVNGAKGAVRHGAETREEWHRAVGKIGRDFLIKEVHPWQPCLAPQDALSGPLACDSVCLTLNPLMDACWQCALSPVQIVASELG